MTLLKISKEGSVFTVDDPVLCGSPPVGRGRTMKEAIGDWLYNNQSRLDFRFKVDESAAKAEQTRRKRELAKR